MATQGSGKTIDVQQVLRGAAGLEVKLLNAGVDVARVYLNQAARFTNVAEETLKAMQDDKATLADAARRFTEFGRQNVQAFADLSRRLGASYYDELDRMAAAAIKASERQDTAPAPTPGSAAAPAKARKARKAATRAR